MQFLAKYREGGLLLLRLTIGLAAILVSAPILLSGSSKWASFAAAFRVIGIHSHLSVWGFIAALLICIGGVLMIFGLFFRLGVLFCLLVVLLQTCAALGGRDTHATLFHVAMCAILLSVLFIGPGKYSVDKT